MKQIFLQRRMKQMSLSNEQLLYLSALAYYNVDTVDVSNKNVKNIINGVRKGEKQLVLMEQQDIAIKNLEWIKLYHLQKMIVN